MSALTLIVTSSTTFLNAAAAGDGTIVTGGTAGKIFIMRTGDMSTALTVLYKVKGSAKAGVDYRVVTGSMTIPAGAAKAKVKIRPIVDAAAAGTLVAKVKLLPADGSYTIVSPSAAKIRIVDNP